MYVKEYTGKFIYRKRGKLRKNTANGGKFICEMDYPELIYRERNGEEKYLLWRKILACEGLYRKIYIKREEN